MKNKFFILILVAVLSFVAAATVILNSVAPADISAEVTAAFLSVEDYEEMQSQSSSAFDSLDDTDELEEDDDTDEEDDESSDSSSSGSESEEDDEEDEDDDEDDEDEDDEEEESDSDEEESSSSSSSSNSQSSVNPPPASEMRGVWISYLEYMTILQGRSESTFRSYINSYFDNCVAAGLNTVIVQVRSHSDAYYNSTIFKTSQYFTGSRGGVASFDPLAIMVEAAHARGLLIEAWINPYRGPSTSVTLPDGDPIKNWIGTDNVFEYKGFYYLNPASSEVRDLVVAGVLEIVRNYNVDGIHFDDYFYPTSDASIDANSFAALGGGRSLSQFRLDNVNTLISSVYSGIKSIKNIPFGISPAGNINNNYGTMSADVRLWGSTAGYVDYLAPQIYWSYGEGSLPYETALANWGEVVTSPSVELIIGQAAYKVGVNNYWTAGNILARQISDARAYSRYGGFIMFRYDQYFSGALATERENVRVLITG